MASDQSQPRSISTSSPTKLPEGIRTSLSTSSSPLHHAEYQQQQYYPITPIRNEQHTPSSQFYQQQQRPQMRHPPHQRKGNRDGGVYFQQHQPGRQTSHPHHYAQGRKLASNIFLILYSPW